MKEDFNKLLNDTKVFLKVNNFKKKNLSFYKQNKEIIYLINFQKSHGNTDTDIKFYINIGLYSTKIDQVINKSIILEPKIYDCHWQSRISSILRQRNDGYYINYQTKLNLLIEQVIKDLENVLYLLKIDITTVNLFDLIIQEGNLNNYLEFIKYLVLTNDNKRLETYLKNLFFKFGSEARWVIFTNNISKLLEENKYNKKITDILLEI